MREASLTQKPDAPASSSSKTRGRETVTEELIRGERTLGSALGYSSNKLYGIANVAYRLLMTGRYDKALTIYQGLVASAPYDSVFRCHLAATLGVLGRYDDALEEYDAALRLNPENVDALVGRGEVYLRHDRLREALEDLGQAIKLDPELERRATQRARATLVALKRKGERVRGSKR